MQSAANSRAGATARESSPRDIYREALFAQNASNLGGLIHGFDRIITQLQREARDGGRDTDWINTHPVCVLFAEQIHHLTRASRNYFAAYRECSEKAQSGFATR